MEAEIVIEYDDEEVAEAIAKAVSPDNFRTPNGLLVKTTCKDTRVLTNIRCKRQLPTFIATIDDILFCVSTAEKTLQTAKKLK